MANTRNKVAIVFDGVVCRVRTPGRTVLCVIPQIAIRAAICRPYRVYLIDIISKLVFAPCGVFCVEQFVRFMAAGFF
ncbi:MAG: hypothetical protein FWH14_08085 [Oscillospiraceae bacterium]|nr:hypothetical protein [Oscillospiraceae bacterium]